MPLDFNNNTHNQFNWPNTPFNTGNSGHWQSNFEASFWNNSFYGFGNYPCIISDSESGDSGSRSGSCMTAEEYRAEQKARNEKTREKQHIYRENDKFIDQIQTKKQDVEKGRRELNASKNNDGSANVAPKRKDLPFWQRAARCVSNIWSGVKNTAKAIVGFDKDGKWNPKKALKNLAIVGGTIILGTALSIFFPVAAPLVFKGIAAVSVAVAGTKTVSTGIKLANAETDEEKDRLEQELGGNVFNLALSATGLRKACATTKALTVKGHGINGTTAKAQGGGWKIWNSEVRLANQQARAFNAANRSGGWKNNLKSDWEAYKVGARATTNNPNGLMKGLGANGKSNYWNGVKDRLFTTFRRTSRVRNYEAQKVHLEQKINHRINEINKLLRDRSLSSAEKNLLNFEKQALINDQRLLAGCTTRSDFDRFVKQNASDKVAEKISRAVDEIESTGSTKLFGKTYTNRDDVWALCKNTKGSIQPTEYQALSQAKLEAMQQQCFSRTARNEVNTYMQGYHQQPQSTGNWWQDLMANRAYASNTRFRVDGAGSMLRKDLLGIKPALRAGGSTAVAPLRIETAFNGIQTTRFGEFVGSDEVTAILEQGEAEIKFYNEALAAANTAKRKGVLFDSAAYGLTAPELPEIV